MNIVFDHERLLQLITSLRTLTGIRATIFDLSGNDICMNDDQAPFCSLINGCREGHSRCTECDAQMVRQCGTNTAPISYRCHAGISETILPIHVGGMPVAFLVFGQLLSNASYEEQWTETEKTLSWYQGDLDELKAAFFQFRRYSGEELAAYTDILEALSSFIQIKEMIHTSDLTDTQKLEQYLDNHFTEKLSLERISSDLGIGRTKLCLLAKKLSGGDSLSPLIAQRRVTAAKKLLLQSSESISSIAEAVGISDYNYFTKVFRSVTGMTPSTFRKTYRDAKVR